MKENLVQWTFLQNLDVLGKCLNFNIAKKIGSEITTDFGRLDFIVEDANRKQLIVELETTLDTKSKRDYCFEQTLRYKNVHFVSDTEYCILYANETATRAKTLVERFGQNEGVSIKTYSLPAIEKLYSTTVEKLSLNVGLAMPTPKNYTICYLRWLNKIMLCFLQRKVYTDAELFRVFNGAETNYNCYKRIALDFELIRIEDNKIVCTSYGEEFLENISPLVFTASNPSSIDLTNEQKRLLLKTLTNGVWDGKVHKTNIYWFLRFIEVTDGEWLPLQHNFDSDRLSLANSLFKVSYKSRSMQEFLHWCCNYCEELELVGRIKSTSAYDRIFLTPLGVQVNNIFSMDLMLKKSRMNLSFEMLGNNS